MPRAPRLRILLLAVVGLLALVLLVGAGAAAWSLRMPGRSHRGPLPPPQPIHEEIEARLGAHVRALSGERNLVRAPDALEAAARYVERELAAAGYTPTDTPVDRSRNVVATLSGASGRVVVVGAHFDTAVGTPGADDNASGVAVMLEIARLMREDDPHLTVRFVAFTGEEAPFLGTGSREDAARLAARDADVAAMLSLESLGYWSTERGSQRYPFPFGLLYPSTGDFVAFVGNLRSRELVRRVTRTFRENARYPSQGAAVPSEVPGAGWSDHASYWDRGWQAVMVTNTALFRNPHYHEPTDRPDTLDLARTARVVTGLVAVVRDLAGARAEPPPGAPR